MLHAIRRGGTVSSGPEGEHCTVLKGGHAGGGPWLNHGNRREPRRMVRSKMYMSCSLKISRPMIEDVAFRRCAPVSICWAQCPSAPTARPNPGRAARIPVAAASIPVSAAAFPVSAAAFPVAAAPIPVAAAPISVGAHVDPELPSRLHCLLSAAPGPSRVQLPSWRRTRRMFRMPAMTRTRPSSLVGLNWARWAI